MWRIEEMEADFDIDRWTKTKNVLYEMSMELRVRMWKT